MMDHEMMTRLGKIGIGMIGKRRGLQDERDGKQDGGQRMGLINRGRGPYY